MQNTTHRIAVFPVLLIMAWASPVTLAHPVSHTDAWIRIGDRIDVRLILFLDDVVRHQAIQPNADGFIDQSVMVQAIEQHSETLLEQLRIFDQQGQALVGRLVSIPRWKPPQRGVNVAADASLKLTWKFDFPAPAGSTALTFLHRFTHETLVQPGELRLHVQDARSGSRTDAVVRPFTPHTVSLSPTDASLTSVADTFQPTTRLIVTRFGVNLEFDCPLPAVSNAWPQVTQLVADSFVQDITLSQQQTSSLQTSLQTWMARNVVMHCNGKALSPQSIDATLLPLNNPDRPVSSGSVSTDTESEPHTVMGSRAAVRLKYVTDQPARSLDVSFLHATGNYDSLTSHVVTHSQSSSRRIPVISQPPTADSNQSTDRSDSEPAAHIQWTAVTEIPAIGGNEEPLQQPASLFLAASHSQTWLLVTMLSVTIVVTVGTRLMRRLRPDSRIGLAGYLLSALFLVGTFAFVWRAAARVDQQACRDLTQQLLNHTYRACLLIDEQASIEQLSTTLHQDMVESVFLAAAEPLASDPDGNPLLDISSVTVDVASAGTATRTGSAIRVDCEWTVRGTFTHWGHAHERNMQLAGQLLLAADNQDQRWKIQQLSLTRPVHFPEMTDEAKTP
jgi:hypothetical protein